MINEFIKLTLAVCLLMGSVTASEKPMVTTAQTPIETVTLLVKKEAQKKFFDQLTTFSERNGFAIRVARIRPDDYHYAVDMWRTDIKILTDNPFDPIDPAQFRIDFYQNSGHPVSTEQINFLVDDLKRLVLSVQGIKLQ